MYNTISIINTAVIPKGSHQKENKFFFYFFNFVSI